MSNKKDFVNNYNNQFTEQPVKDINSSADMNVPERTFWLGYCFEYGIGVEKDENKAFSHYKKSSDMNNSNGMYHVGNFYYLGIGVEMDKHQAFIYYQKSADAGNSMGIFKTAICYYYGIGVEKSYDKYNDWIRKVDPTSLPIRDSKYGKCTLCNEDNTNPGWCQACDPDITVQGWTSGNKDIDYCIKEIQLRINEYELMIEWIPFDGLVNIQKIKEGGFSSVYSAIWLDGIRKIVDDHGNYIKVREPSSDVALKTLSSSKESFLKEFNNYLKCRIGGNRLSVYGITKNTETNEFLIVFQYCDNGSLDKFLKLNFRIVTWQIKLQLLLDISYDLSKIHGAGYIHSNLYSSNILLDQCNNEIVHSYVSGLRLSKKDDEYTSEDNIYGVMPYVAPEVLSGKKITKAADIYSFGIIMSEMSTGQTPFNDYNTDIGLAMKICNGLQPEFSSGTPNFYIELARQCMDLDPQKRPTAYDIWDKLTKWNVSMKGSDDKVADEIKKQFLDADKLI